MKPLFMMAVAVILAASTVPIHGQENVFLKIGCQDEPKALNIWNSSDIWGGRVTKWFYPSLYYKEPITQDPLPDVCTMRYDEVLAESPDGLTYLFPLRTDVYWDDGMPLTAYDFEMSYTIITSLQISAFMDQMKDVEYVKAIDDYIVEIKLTECTPQFEEKLIYQFAVPAHQFSPLLEEALATDAPALAFTSMYIENPVSAGPFSFDQWEKETFVRLVTNPDYYGKGRKVTVKGLGEREEGPFYDGIVFKPYSTTDAALMDIQKGEIDCIWWNLDPGYVVQLKDNPDITVEITDDLGWYYLAPNCAKPPFDDVKLRQALVYLVDKEYFVERILQGYGGVAHSVVMPAAGEWYNDTVNTYGCDKARDERTANAREALTTAGYTVPDEKYPAEVVKLPDGTEMQPFTILTPPADYDPVRAMAGILIQGWWRELGIPVTTKPAPFGEIVHEVFEAQTFDWYLLGWSITGSPYPDYLRYFFHSDQAVPDGNNPMGYKNPQVDKCLEDLVALCDHDALVEAAHEVQELVIEEVAYIPLFYRTLNEAHRNDTFEGWFTQLGGVGGDSSPTYCLLYLKPITAQEEKTPCLGTVLVVMLVAASVVAYRRT